jgi:hypothetical protein
VLAEVGSKLFFGERPPQGFVIQQRKPRSFVRAGVAARLVLGGGSRRCEQHAQELVFEAAGPLVDYEQVRGQLLNLGI